ncbi:MAG: SpoIIIAH-like family protein [Clostridia bacterium]|nr:SpoIIIAH-like family protein [Clostridia bacterium]
MSLKVKRILALCVCCVLLAAAIYQNIRTDDTNSGADVDSTISESSEDVIFVQDYNSEEAGNIDGEQANTDVDLTGIKCDSPLDYIAGLRIEREAYRSALTEECMSIIESTSSSDAEVSIAQDEILAVNSMTETEDLLESALKSRGYEDVFAEYNDDGCIDIVLIAKNISESEIETITSMVYSESGVTSEYLTVSSVYRD